MTFGPRAWLSIVALNTVLALAVLALAPAQPGTTADRVGYEYVAQHGLAPDCPHTIFCYRVLVPLALDALPGPEVARWRVFACLANIATGVLLGLVATQRHKPLLAALLAAVLYQCSFGATFAVFDPFTPDAAVYLGAAALALCWLHNRPLLAALIASVGSFAKEAVALVAVVTAVAALLLRRDVRPWLLAAAIPCALVLGFHLAMDVFFGWTEGNTGSADLAGGAWLARWLADTTLTPLTRLLYLFIPFGFAWVYAGFGVRHAGERLRALALASPILVTMLYVQTPERALATASFVVVPLAAIFLVRAPVALAVLAALSNGLLTARVGLSVAWLPGVPYLFALTGGLAALTVWWGWIGGRQESSRGVPGVSVVAPTSSR